MIFAIFGFFGLLTYLLWNAPRMGKSIGKFLLAGAIDVATGAIDTALLAYRFTLGLGMLVGFYVLALVLAVLTGKQILVIGVLIAGVLPAVMCIIALRALKGTIGVAAGTLYKMSGWIHGHVPIVFTVGKSTAANTTPNLATLIARLLISLGLAPINSVYMFVSVPLQIFEGLLGLLAMTLDTATKGVHSMIRALAHVVTWMLIFTAIYSFDYQFSLNMMKNPVVPGILMLIAIFLTSSPLAIADWVSNRKKPTASASQPAPSSAHDSHGSSGSGGSGFHLPDFGGMRGILTALTVLLFSIVAFAQAAPIMAKGMERNVRNSYNHSVKAFHIWGVKGETTSDIYVRVNLAVERQYIRRGESWAPVANSYVPAGCVGVILNPHETAETTNTRRKMVRVYLANDLDPDLVLVDDLVASNQVPAYWIPDTEDDEVLQHVGKPNLPIQTCKFGPIPPPGTAAAVTAAALSHSHPQAGHATMTPSLKTQSTKLRVNKGDTLSVHSDVAGIYFGSIGGWEFPINLRTDVIAEDSGILVITAEAENTGTHYVEAYDLGPLGAADTGAVNAAFERETAGKVASKPPDVTDNQIHEIQIVYSRKTEATWSFVDCLGEPRTKLVVKAGMGFKQTSHKTSAWILRDAMTGDPLLEIVYPTADETHKIE